jgi:Zn-finger nucleic acid-binding protein
MTKYTNERNRWAPRDTGTPISLPNYEEIESRKEFFCPYCQLKLSRLVDSSGQNTHAFYCPKCTIEYPDQSEVKSKSSLSTPRQKSNNENPAVSYAPEVELKRKKTKVRGGLAELQKRGIKVTSYTESKG